MDSEERKKQIKGLQKEGKSFDEIQQITGLAESTLRKLRVSKGKTKPKAEREKEIRNLVEKNKYDYYEELAEDLGLTPKVVQAQYGGMRELRNMQMREYIRIPGNTRRDEEKDGLIRDGVHYKDIAIQVGVTPARILQYMGESGQREEYDRQIQINERKHTRTLELFLEAGRKNRQTGENYEMTKREKFAYQKASRWAREENKISDFKMVYNLMGDYWDAKHTKTDKSVASFASSYQVRDHTVRKIFDTTGVKSLGAQGRKKSLSKHI